MEVLQIWVKNMETKEDIRTFMNLERSKLTEDTIQCYSDKITKHVIEHQLFQNAQSIYCYINCKREVITTGIINAAWAMNKRVAVPKVEGTNMNFYYIQDFTDLSLGYFRILEPTTTQEAEDDNALLIMPLLAFDTQCNRLGYGGGFYDRYLKEHPQYDTIAIAYELQRVPCIPTEGHDLKPKMIITEGRRYEEKIFVSGWL